MSRLRAGQSMTSTSCWSKKATVSRAVWGGALSWTYTKLRPNTPVAHGNIWFFRIWMYRCRFMAPSTTTSSLLPPWWIAPHTMTDGPRFPSLGWTQASISLSPCLRRTIAQIAPLSFQAVIPHKPRILCKARRYLNLETLKTFYYAFLFPHLYYCIEVWGNTFIVHIDPLEKMIKRALRLISGSNRRAHTAPLFENLEILTLRKLYMYVYSIQLFMYKFHHKLLLRIFLDYFVTNYDVHDYDTRQRGCLHATHNRSHSIRYVGVKISNHFMSLLEMNMYYLLYKTNLRYLVLTSDVSHLLD